MLKIVSSIVDDSIGLINAETRKPTNVMQLISFEIERGYGIV